MNEFLRTLLWLPEQASTYSKLVDHLHYFVIITTFFASFGVGTTAVLFFVKYRRRREGQRTPHVTSGMFLEGIFVFGPLTIFLVWFAIGYRDYVHLSTPPPNSMDVYVMGKQWMWKFAYPDGPNAVSVLRVPAGRPVRLLMTSRDVIHSFFVPAFRLKQDVLPGRYSQTWFEATEPGRYEVLCTQYCGAGHSTMRAEVVVMKPEEFDEWLRDQRRGEYAERQDGSPTDAEPFSVQANLAEQGRRATLQYGCAKCHSVDGSPHIGPTWLGLYQRVETMAGGEKVLADEAYLTESIMDPLAKIVRGYQPVMPSYQGRLSSPETAAIVEYIKTLRTDAVQNQPAKGPVYEPSRSARAQ